MSIRLLIVFVCGFSIFVSRESS